MFVRETNGYEQIISSNRTEDNFHWKMHVGIKATKLLFMKMMEK